MKKSLNNSLDWDIKSQPVSTITGLPTNHRAIMRTDNNQILGIVGSKYKPFANRQLIKLCKTIERVGNFKTEGFSEFKGGKLVMAFIRNQNPALKLSGLDLNEYLVIGNSHDESRQLFIGTAQHLIRCENQFFSSVPLFKARHICGLGITDDFAKMLRNEYEVGRKALYNAIETLPNKKIHQGLIDNLIIHLLNTDKEVPDDAEKKRIMNSIQGKSLRASIDHETKDLGMNAFGLFNGVTWFTSHELKTTAQNFGNATGVAQELNAKALEYCNKL